MDSKIINLTLSFIYFIESPLIHLFTHSVIILLLIVAPQIQKDKVNMIIDKAYVYYDSCNSSLWLIQRQLINKKNQMASEVAKDSNQQQKIAPGFLLTKPVAPMPILSFLIDIMVSTFYSKKQKALSHKVSPFFSQILLLQPIYATWIPSMHHPFRFTNGTLVGSPMEHPPAGSSVP